MWHMVTKPVKVHISTYGFRAPKNVTLVALPSYASFWFRTTLDVCFHR